MYAEFFGLAELPFNNTPDPRFYYATPDHEEALASMIYAVSEGKGLMLLTGEVGAGKTLLTKMLTHHLGSRICTAAINHTVASACDLLSSICDGFGLPMPADAGASTCIRMLHDFLLAQRAYNIPVVLMIDEAQGLPRESFEQLRTLGNMENNNATLLQTLIIGQPSLRRLFQLPDMHKLHQRIFRAFHLPALTRVQCPGYVQHRLNVAGAEDAQIFDDSAIEVIHGYSHGSARLINTLCDNAMLSAYSADMRTVSGELVEGVISQMLTIDQRHVPRDATHVTSIPPPVYLARDVRERIERIESGHGSLADRVGRIEFQIGTLAGSTEQASAQPTGLKPAGVDAETRAGPATVPPVCSSDSADPARERDAALTTALKEAERNTRQAMVGKLADITRQTDAKLATALGKAEDRLHRITGKTEDKLTDVAKDADERLTRVARKTDDLYQRFPKLAAASARRDQQFRRLTSVVKRIAEHAQENRTETKKHTSAADSEPATWWSALAAHDEPGARNATQPVVTASERLKELAHQAQTSMGDLRSLIADRSCPASEQPPTPVTAFPSRLESPVTLLASEVKYLSDVAEKS